MSPVMPHAVRILLVEDDLLLADHLQTYLLDAGYQVAVCNDGHAAQCLATQDTFDLILMNIMLPGCDGLEILQYLRTRCGVPVLLMSALGGEQNRITGFSYGADDYLPKPFSVNELGGRIEGKRPANPS
ncbi:response regulator transcription factor [Pseudomonas sp. C27(2019)]|uniref:response regulator transcription factor n=1 Tax=Pseudomonas sp. C27(2019) TaxID=2604941 RepID=UPI001248E12A|nr:response regulator [Pseudomonas sp. C27(2019)]QEY60172.1 response regulator transcription factor [Pseudomonas sp. C27(2019)]